MKDTLILLLLLPLFLNAQHKTNSREAKLLALMELAGIPGLSLAWVEKGELAEMYHLGVRSNDTKEMVDKGTVFSAASLSKPIFAYGAMKLVEAGKLDLDRPLYEYLPYADLEHDDRNKIITARQILSHTSGLPNWRGRGQLNFQYDPGKRFRYSGEGFVYLMRVVEKITGQSIEAYMQEVVFQPLGMDRTSYIWQERMADNYAFPHNEMGKSSRKYYPEEGNTAHSLQTTAADYGKFLQALIQREGLKGSTYRQMFSAQENSALQEEDDHLHWGLGFGLQENSAGTAFWQWGDNGTYKAFVIGNPENKEGLVYFTNSSMGLAVASELLALFFEEEQPSIKWLDYGGIKEPSLDLLKRILSMDFSEAVAPYLHQDGTFHDTSLIPEWKMNRLGYQLLNHKKLDAAKKVFSMNMAAFPNSSNVYDSFAEACLRSGDYEEAKTYYRKAAEIDPGNKNAQLIADRLESGNKGKVEFRLASYQNALHVSLAGAFNDWNELSLPMQWENGAWVCRLDLEPGTYQYKFIVDGVWIPDPSNPKINTEDNFNSIRTVK